MIIDTHSHLNFKAYDSDREEVIKRTQEQGVVCIDVGTKYETSKQAVELAEKYENIYAAIGMHPIYAGAQFVKIKTDPNEGEFLVKEQNFDYEKYRNLAKSKKVVAIGEIGLDYYYKPKTKIKLEQFKTAQKKVFVEQLELAKELNLPVILHCRMAHQDILEILKTNNTKGVIHCFTGNQEEAQQYINLGFYIGLNGIIFKLDMQEVIKNCSLNRILIETDCPYLTPPIEGKDKRNEPIFIKYTIQKIADLKGISFEEVAEITTQNARELFRL
ncbi:MAG: TatD family hydrolase [Patescibacteria group bacterium]